MNVSVEKEKKQRELNRSKKDLRKRDMEWKKVSF